MKEVIFIRQNTEKWERYEACLLNIAQQTPDQLADIYIDITNDLSFSRTFYPNSKTTRYLNGLSSRLHQFIYGKKKEKLSRFVTYWTEEVPIVMYQARKQLLFSFIIFAVSCLIGAFSAANDEDFARVILGDRYVDMTLENIENNDPMAVYKDEQESSMFATITLNNIRVSFSVFAAGVLTSLGPGYLLLQNGIMLGSFQYFFYEHDLFWESFLTIWIHGTLEISAIIIAGAGGITMGNAWLFPGTYTRIASFRRGARQGMKIIAGLIPIFIVAGFLESYITRHTELPDLLRLGIILFSLFFVISYFVLWPMVLVKQKEHE